MVERVGGSIRVESDRFSDIDGVECQLFIKAKIKGRRNPVFGFGLLDKGQHSAPCACCLKDCLFHEEAGQALLLAGDI